MELSIVPALFFSPRRALPLQSKRAARQPLQQLPGHIPSGHPAVVRFPHRRRNKFLVAMLFGVWILFAGGTVHSDRFFGLLGVVVGVGVSVGGGEDGVVSTSYRAVRT